MPDVVELFQRGSRDYWAGEVPDGWEDPAQRESSPYLQGWYLESMAEVNSEWIDWRDE